jgi:pimeloyl-ACP methyl ester carboxylesterase
VGGHETFTPTIKGNRPGDSKTIGLAEAIRSVVDYLVENHLSDIVLVGHSYGGMIITGVADIVPERIRRLIYWNAFVPTTVKASATRCRDNMSRCLRQTRLSAATAQSFSLLPSGGKRLSTTPTSAPLSVPIGS